MTDYRLSDLASCFEGVIPSIIATASADGTPNISYLSHVVRVDETHVALSNQFFAKTAANIRANPHATIILVDCLTGDQFLLSAHFVQSVDNGPLFEKIALQLKASSAQIGMSDVMRLRSADIFRVARIEIVPSPVAGTQPHPRRAPISLPTLVAAGKALEKESEAERIIDDLLGAVAEILGCSHALVLLRDAHRACLVTMGSIGYDRSGLGSEVAETDGLIGTAARTGQTVKVNDMSRVRRLGDAIARDSETSEDEERTVAFPALATPMSQIAVPICARGQLLGILFAESRDRMAFGDEDEAALEMLAGHAGHALNAIEEPAAASDAPSLPPPEGQAADGPMISIAHYAFDDSIFVDDAYIVKGVAGALLRQIIEWHFEGGRTDFSNRELRLALAARMPDIKDNLETRLLLLRRRLDEKSAPLRIIRIARGQIRLETDGPLTFVERR